VIRRGMAAWRSASIFLLLLVLLGGCMFPAAPQSAGRDIPVEPPRRAAIESSEVEVPEPIVEEAVPANPELPEPPVPAMSSSDPARPRTLQETLDAVASRHNSRLGIFVKHLETGEEASLSGDARFRSASLYKLFVLYSAFQRVESGEMTLDEMVTLSQAAVERDPYAEWPAGTRTTINCALEAMITVSNNAAASMLVERVGGRARINADIRALGLTQSDLTGGYAQTSPRDIALLLEAIARKRAGSPAASESMLDLLLAQRRDDRLPLPLPPYVRVAHKTGELPKLRNDAGIVYAPSGPYIVVGLSGDAPNDVVARAALVDLSREVYSYFEPEGLDAYRGLPPRLAQEIFRVPDGQGRLAPLADEWARNVSLDRAGVALVKGRKNLTLQDVAVPDLIALQQAAASAGAAFWVSAGYRAPAGIDAPKVLPGAPLSCRVEFPPRKVVTSKPTAQPATPTPTPTRAPAASQHWLGTVVAISDSFEGSPAAEDYPTSTTGRWLIDHAWEYGFILAPAESSAGMALWHEPWKLRWVGREMAAHLHDVTPGPRYTATIQDELRRAQQELVVPPTRRLAIASRP
jgi:beta-lactamase class A